MQLMKEAGKRIDIFFVKNEDPKHFSFKNKDSIVFNAINKGGRQENWHFLSKMTIQNTFHSKTRIPSCLMQLIKEGGKTIDIFLSKMMIQNTFPSKTRIPSCLTQLIKEAGKRIDVFFIKNDDLKHFSFKNKDSIVFNAINKGGRQENWLFFRQKWRSKTLFRKKQGFHCV